MPKKKIEIKKHVLIPQHIKLSEKEKKQVFEAYHISVNELPRISIKDPALASISVKAGDVIKITRESPTAGTTFYYRAIVNE